MKELIIVGYGGFGREVAWLAEDCGYSVPGFLDDGVAAGKYGAYRVLGNVAKWAEYEQACFVVAIGNPRVRKKVVAAMSRQGKPPFATLVHPSVIMSKSGTIGTGTMICAGTVATVDFTVGEHAIIYTNCTVTHDDRIGDFVTIAPLAAISGNVALGDGVEIGAGASIRQGVTMGAGSMLGMGGVLINDAEPNQVYVGSPAKPLKALPDFEDS